MGKYKYTRRSHYRTLPSGKRILVRGHVANSPGDKTKTGHAQDMKRFNKNQKHERLYRGIKKKRTRVRGHYRYTNGKRVHVRGHIRDL